MWQKLPFVFKATAYISCANATRFGSYCRFTAFQYKSCKKLSFCQTINNVEQQHFLDLENARNGLVNIFVNMYFCYKVFFV